MLEEEDRVASSRRWSVGLPLVLLAWFGLVGPAPPTLAFEQAGGEEKVQTTDPWEPFRLLEGHWEGAIDGRLGQGTGRRHITFILDGKFLLLRHASVRLPQEKSPRGDYHREMGVFSFDRERGMVIYREFLVEGFVNRYTCDVEPKKFVCTTESVENGPGMRARLTVEISDRYRFDEIFELASPGKELEVYFTNRWTRVPNLDD
jgi:hypothetical protein